MSLTFKAGDLTIQRIIEQETSFVPALEMLPSLTPDMLAENRAWMQAAVKVLAISSFRAWRRACRRGRARPARQSRRYARRR